MDHSHIMGMITSPASWEQIIYDVVAAEGLDPWDLDISKLASGFMKHVEKLETMDFKVPAKYVMVASTLLRMKSDHLPLLDYFQQPEEPVLDNGVDGPAFEVPPLNPLSIPPRRQPQRRIVVSELIDALRKVLNTVDRREMRIETAKSKIKIKQEDISKRISALYDKINAVLFKMNAPEVEFSSLVPEWNKESVASTFLPLVYLDHQKKIECRQEDFFKEIYVRKIGAVTAPVQAALPPPLPPALPAPHQVTRSPVRSPVKEKTIKPKTERPIIPIQPKIPAPKVTAKPKTPSRKSTPTPTVKKPTVKTKKAKAIKTIEKKPVVKDKGLLQPVKSLAEKMGWVPIKEKATKKKRRKR